MKSKSGLIIGLVIFFIILLSGGVFAGLYFGTDLFKSEQQKFWKYMAQNKSTMEMVRFKDLTNYGKVQRLNSVETTGEAKFYIQDGQNDVKSILKRMTLKTAKTFDKDKRVTQIDTKLMVDDYQLFNVAYINDGDKYALKSDEVAQVAIGIENNNLKDFARKMGYEDTSEIPDKIESNIDNIVAYPEEKIAEVFSGYLNAVYDIIPKEKYLESKGVSVTVNEKVEKANLYYLVLSEEEAKNLELNLLNYAKQDAKTKEFLMTMFKDGSYDGENIDEKYIDSKIDDMIDEVKDYEATTDEYLRINLYVAGKRLIRTEVVAEGDQTVSFEYLYDGSKEQLVVSSVEKSDVRKATILKERVGDEIKTNIVTEGLEDYDIELQIKTRGTVEQNTMKLEIEGSAKDKEETDIKYCFSFVEKADFKKPISTPELNQNNSAMLNDFSIEQNQALLLALTTRITDLIKQKTQYINMTYSEGFTGVPSIDNGVVFENEGTSEELNETEEEENTTTDDIQLVQPIVNDVT